MMIRIACLLLLTIGLLLIGCRVQTPAPTRQTVILISLDGFRPDYLSTDSTPTLMRLANTGVRAKWLIPSFPSKTFPNHYSIATGLYPAHHGIVENRFWDPVLQADYASGRRPDMTDSRWWGGEPIWITAEKQGVRTAPLFWVGSEATINSMKPTYSLPFKNDMPNPARVDTLLAWLDLPANRRPTFLTLYLSLTDDAGHRYGPDAPQTRSAARQADQTIAQLLQGLAQRGLTSSTNVVVVSDHGMAAVSTSRVIFLDDAVNLDWVEHSYLGELTALWPKPGKADSVYLALTKTPIPHLQVYRRDDLPARFHYQNSPRIAPILCLPDAGWSVTRHAAFGKLNGSFANGAHGYDNQDPAMRAIFIANGPAFPKGVVAEPFENVNIYPLLCQLLHIVPAPVDGKQIVELLND